MNESPGIKLVAIKELATLCSGYSPRPEERKHQGTYLLIGGRNIKNGRLVMTEKDAYVDNIPRDSFSRAIAQPGDIIVSILFDRRKLCIYRDTSPKAVVNNSCAIIRATNNNDYISSYLRTIKGQEQFLQEATNATGGNFIPRLSVSELSNIRIPLLPISELQRLGDDHIENSPTDDLIALDAELRGKDIQIRELQEKLSTLIGKEKENQNLKNELTQITAYYEDRLSRIESQISTNDLRGRINHGETSKFEFKSSLRWNLKAKRIDSNIELAVLKTLVAFCNTAGGELLIGVADDHSIIGIDQDRFSNDDKFLLHLRNLVMGKIIPSPVQYIEYETMNLEGKSICHIICKQSVEDVWLKPNKNTPEVFYVRSGPSSTELPPRQALRYIQEHFQK